MGINLANSAWHLCLIFLCIVSLFGDTHLAAGHDEAEPHILPQPLNHDRGGNPRAASAPSSNSITAILMVAALSWALLEYAQLALMLITDTEAVQMCYEQHCSVADMNERMAADMPVSPHKAVGMRRDSISANLLATPSELSDAEYEAKFERGHDRNVGTERHSPTSSICGCKEEDFLVALEDDVRKPCMVISAVHPHPPIERLSEHLVKVKHTSAADTVEMDRAQTEPIKLSGVAEPLMEIKREAGGLNSGPSSERAEMLHHFKDELVPAAEASPMDVL